MYLSCGNVWNKSLAKRSILLEKENRASCLMAKLQKALHNWGFIADKFKMKCKGCIKKGKVKQSICVLCCVYSALGVLVTVYKILSKSPSL